MAICITSAVLTLGVAIVRRALEEPLRHIAQNAGQEGAVVVGKVREGSDNFGFNAATEKYEDLVAAGVIDPAKVTRTALQNAASIAGLMLTTEAMIADAPTKRATAEWATWEWECKFLSKYPNLLATGV